MDFRSQPSLPSDPRNTVKIKRRLGIGGWATVYQASSGDQKFALKVFKEKSYFCREYEAYENISKVDALRDHIPAYHGISEYVHHSGPRRVGFYRRGLLFDVVDGITLDHVIETLSEDQLGKIDIWLCGVLTTLHEKAGVCHGDIRKENIMLSRDHTKLWLIDFSHAKTRTRTEPRVFRRKTVCDFGMMEEVFRAEEARRARVTAFTLLTSATIKNRAHQEQLAQIVDLSLSSENALSEDLLDAVRDTLEAPIPKLARLLEWGFRKVGSPRLARDFLYTYFSRLPSCPKESDDHDLLTLRIIFAKYHGRFSSSEIADAVFTQTTGSFVQALGKTHPFTLDILFEHASYLQGKRRFEDAIRLCLNTVQDIQDVSIRKEGNDVDLAPDQLSPLQSAEEWSTDFHAAMTEWLPKLDHEAPLRKQVEGLLEGTSGTSEKQHLQLERELKRKRDDTKENSKHDLTKTTSPQKKPEIVSAEDSRESDKENMVLR